MGNDLKQQLLKAGLAKKSDVARVVREQVRQRHAKSPRPPLDAAGAVDAKRLQAERADHDRQLAAARNAQLRQRELGAQAVQIIDAARVPGRGEIPYAFQDGRVVARIAVDLAQRSQLAAGALVVARHAGGFVLLPRAAADKVAARDATLIVADHAGAADTPGDADPAYAEFPIPDDLVW